MHVCTDMHTLSCFSGSILLAAVFTAAGKPSLEFYNGLRKYDNLKIKCLPSTGSGLTLSLSGAALL